MRWMKLALGSASESLQDGRKNRHGSMSNRDKFPNLSQNQGAGGEKDQMVRNELEFNVMQRYSTSSIDLSLVSFLLPHPR